MDTAKGIQASFKKLHEKIKSGKDISEEELRVAFVNCGILEVLGYEGVLKDVRFEKNVKRKRSDLIAFDDYQNAVFVVEFKRPMEIDLERDFAQLWERYVKLLKAKYGILTDGLELLLYERINSNWERKLRVNLGEVALSQCEEVYGWLKKPSIERTRIEAVLGHFERFDNPEEKAYSIFGDRIKYVGPDCGLGPFPSQELAYMVLKNTSTSITAFKTTSKKDMFPMCITAKRRATKKIPMPGLKYVIALCWMIPRKMSSSRKPV
jgi:hypothetical protein